MWRSLLAISKVGSQTPCRESSIFSDGMLFETKNGTSLKIKCVRICQFQQNSYENQTGLIINLPGFLLACQMNYSAIPLANCSRLESLKTNFGAPELLNKMTF